MSMTLTTTRRLLSLWFACMACGCAMGDAGDPLPTPALPPAAATVPAVAPRPSSGPATAGSLALRPPAALSALAGANVQRVELSWQEPSPVPEAYLVERSTDAADFARVAIVSAPAGGFSDIHELSPQTTYTYRVKAWSGGRASIASAPATATTGNFRLFDAMLFQGKPNLATSGLHPIYIAYEGRFFRASSSDQRREMDADPRLTADVAREAARLGRLMVVDIECWPSDPLRDGDDAMVQTMRRLLQVIQWAKAAAPGLKVGVYGFPQFPGHGSRDGKPAKTVARDAMQSMLPLYEAVDFITPSLYASSDDPKLWVGRAQETIAQSRELGKPVYPFLMMVYHDSSPAGMAGKPVPAELWAIQLRTLRGIADGAILWGGNRRRWDPQAEWWRETLKFAEFPQ